MGKTGKDQLRCLNAGTENYRTLQNRAIRRTIVIEKIKPWIEGKRVLLLGFGREGQSTFHVLKQVGGYTQLDIADLSSPASRPDEAGLWITGPDYQKCLDNYDVVFKSPGIVLELSLIHI